MGLESFVEHVCAARGEVSGARHSGAALPPGQGRVCLPAHGGHVGSVIAAFPEHCALPGRAAPRWPLEASSQKAQQG